MAASLRHRKQIELPIDEGGEAMRVKTRVQAGDGSHMDPNG